MTGTYGPGAFQADSGVSGDELAALQAYADLLVKWSGAVNLVGRRTLPELWRRHMLDSAQLLEHLPPAPADRPRRIADLGSGAGFPGLVLAILGAGEVHLVESDARKAAFLREAARAAGAAAVLHVQRIESLAPLAADVVTARALAPLPELLGYAAAHLAPGGVGLLLKGREAERELTAARKAWKMTVQRRPSRSDPTGTILRVEGIERRDARP